MFAGGVGEHSAVDRAETCAPVDWMGIALDPDANSAVDAADSPIGAPGSPVVTLVIHSRGKN